MVLLGLLLVIIALAAGVALFLGTEPLTSEVEFEVGVLNFVFTPLQLLIAGAAVMLLLALGLALIRGALARRRRARQQAKDAQRQAELEESVRRDERTRADEAHRSELAERERAWEAERAERDRTREEEFEARRAELEQRIRLDERGRVAREVDPRQGHSATGSGDQVRAGTAGAAGVAAAASAGHHSSDDRREPSEHDRGTFGNGIHEPRDHRQDESLHHDGDVHEPRHGDGDTVHGSSAAGLADDSGTDRTERLERDADRDADYDADRDADYDADRDADDRSATERRPVVEPAEPGERTVADRLMGRHPERRD